jgi:hypothetical protein
MIRGDIRFLGWEPVDQAEQFNALGAEGAAAQGTAEGGPYCQIGGGRRRRSEPVPKPAPATPVASAVRQASKLACQLAALLAPTMSHEMHGVPGAIVQCESIAGARA